MDSTTSEPEWLAGMEALEERTFEAGEPLGLHLMDWLARQLVQDARALGDALLARLQHA